MTQRERGPAQERGDYTRAPEAPPPHTLPTSPEADEVILAMIADLSAQRDALGESFARLCHAEVPELNSDEDILPLTIASGRGNFDTFFALMAARGVVEGSELAYAVMKWPRELARRGIGMAPVLRAYRVAGEGLWGMWKQEVERRVDDPELRSEILEFCMRYSFGYVDHVSERVVEEHIAEQERRRRSAAAVREDTARALIDGTQLDIDVAERRLGYPLRQHHVGFVAWDLLAAEGEQDRIARVEAAVRAAARELTPAEPLLVAAGELVWGWAGQVEPIAPAAVERLVSSTNFGNVGVAVGEPASGPAGFRQTHRQAVLARRIAHLAGERRGEPVRYADVSAVSLMTVDLDRARAFVHDELGALAADDATSRRLRHTLEVYLDEGGRWRQAAERLSMHQNTVVRRVRRAEELIGRDIGGRRFEIEAALRLAHVVQERESA